MIHTATIRSSGRVVPVRIDWARGDFFVLRQLSYLDRGLLGLGLGVPVAGPFPLADPRFELTRETA
jgi:hypothetical protein